MTLGTYNRHQAKRKKEVALAAAFPQGIRCQKCLELGHWSYECKNKRKFLVRESRTQILKRNLKTLENENQQSKEDTKAAVKSKKRKKSPRSSSSSSSSNDSSSDSSSSSDSESDSSSSSTSSSSSSSSSSTSS